MQRNKAGMKTPDRNPYAFYTARGEGGGHLQMFPAFKQALPGTLGTPYHQLFVFLGETPIDESRSNDHDESTNPPERPKDSARHSGTIRWWSGTAELPSSPHKPGQGLGGGNSWARGQVVVLTHVEATVSHCRGAGDRAKQHGESS